MHPVFAREPEHDSAYEFALDNDMRLQGLPKHADSMSIGQIEDELILMLQSPTVAMAQLLRQFRLNFTVSGRWTRTKEKKYEAFFARLLRDGHPECAHVYRIRQLVAALQKFHITAATSVAILHYTLMITAQIPFPVVKHRNCVRHGLQ